MAVIVLQENIDSYYTLPHFFRCCCAYNGAEVEVRLWAGSVYYELKVLCIMNWKYYEVKLLWAEGIMYYELEE